MSGLQYLQELFDDFCRLNREQKEFLSVILASNAFENSDIIALVDDWIIQRAADIQQLPSKTGGQPKPEEALE